MYAPCLMLSHSIVVEIFHKKNEKSQPAGVARGNLRGSPKLLDSIVLAR